MINLWDESHDLNTETKGVSRQVLLQDHTEEAASILDVPDTYRGPARDGEGLPYPIRLLGKVDAKEPSNRSRRRAVYAPTSLAAR